MKHLLFEVWDRVLLLEDEAEILPGVRGWWAGTHHSSSMVYSIPTEAGIVWQVTAPSNIKTSKGILSASPRALWKAYKRIRKEAAIFLPLYDPAIQIRYPDGCVA